MRIYRYLLVIGCALAAIAPVRVLVTGTPLAFSAPATLPGGGWLAGLDPLSSAFMLVVLFVGAMCGLFGASAMARAHTTRAAWRTHAWFSVLLVSMVFVVSARSVVLFLMAWEIMAISSYVLIVTEHDQAGVRRGGLIFLATTHTATLALFAMFAIMARGGGDWSFETLARTAPSLSPAATNAVLALALVGFGLKAGLVPFHFWLPPAHAAAPSHVSALLSGVVIKTGIYGLFRVVLILGGAPAWWGWLVLGLGIASGILGVLWALAQHDIKRLLAYHSVENIGIILMGLGIGVLGTAYSMPAVALLGFAGAVLHTINHALFKSLLFLGAGSVYAATGTRQLDRLGGIARRMPFTWIAFAVGATAIIGLPPLNGFVSEWLVFVGFHASSQSHTALRLAVLGIPALALIGALALACFAKVSGVVFLGTARTAEAAGARESPVGMLAPMFALSAACVVLGVAPLLGVSIATRAAAALAGAGPESLPAIVPDGTRGISLVAVFVVGVVAALWGLRFVLLRGRVVRYDRTWGCAYATSTPRAQYTAASLASPLVSLFGRLSGLRTDRTADALHTHPVDIALDGLAIPLWHAAQRAALRLRPIQQGRLHHYLLYVMAALVVLLGYLFASVRG